MNTTTTVAAAAIEAKVTVATIRTWCRLGAVAAVKQAGRWVIDTASLAARIAIGQYKTRKTPKPAVYSVETMTAIGGSRWQRGDKDRVYINNWARFAGIECDTYKSGNISGATWQGNLIPNRQASLLLGSIDKVWYDTADGKLHCRYGYTESRVADREQVWDAVVTGIRGAIAAL